MIEIGKNSQVRVVWKVNPYDFSSEKINEIQFKISRKYNIPKDKVKVVPDFIINETHGSGGKLGTDIISNIHQPQFQITLFDEYLKNANITNCDFQLIRDIDAQINSYIDYNEYETQRKYSIKWVKWDNFLSYGEDNYFDFTSLNGLVLLSGEPANQSGKTTFAIDLLHFLLFGKTDKAVTLDKIFNKHLKEATKVVVEGCINIEGDDYIIKRTLSRPILSKRSSKSKTTQKVEYYKIVGDTREELGEFIEDKQGESSIQTNKIIKDAIGQESDFDMVICATSANLDDLIEKKDTERGKLLSRWIGLLPLEQKDIIAREYFNKNIKPYLISHKYSEEELKSDISTLEMNIGALQDENKRYENEINDVLKEITLLENNQKTLLLSKKPIDEKLLMVDVNTLQRKIENLANDGKLKKHELESIENELKTLENVEFSMDEYKKILEENHQFNIQLQLMRQEYLNIKNKIDDLTKSEYCPTCKRKYENIDNSKQIEELNDKISQIGIDGVVINNKMKQNIEIISQMEENRVLYENKSRYFVKKSALELQIEQLRNHYKEQNAILIEYQKNNEIIDLNNQIDIQLRNIEITLKGKQNIKLNNSILIEKNKVQIEQFNKNIKERNDLIFQLKEEIKNLYHWNLYLEMVGKNGVSKMVLRKTLPIINAHLTRLLNDICDFNIEIDINEKNEVMFYLIKDNVKSDLTSGSGFERTASALALRAVLGNISTLPKINILILDEILGRVAKENYENMRTLYDKILENYDAIIQISHLNEIRDWHDKHIVVSKENNVSKLKLQ